MQKQSLIRIEREKMTSAREFGLIAKDTDDDDISRFAESAGMFNSCLGMLRRPPTSQAFTYLSAQIDQASDPRGSSFTLDKGDMCGNKPAQQRAVNTNLTNATQLHGMNPVAASSASAASAQSMVASFLLHRLVILPTMVDAILLHAVVIVESPLRWCYTRK